MTRKIRILAAVLAILTPAAVFGASPLISGFAAFVAGLAVPTAPTGSETVPLVQNGATTAMPLTSLASYLQNVLPFVTKTYVLGFLQQNYTLQVPSAAALRNLVGFPGIMVRRGGFLAPGDGGGALYAFNTTACGADDGGSCENASGGGSWRIDWGSVGNVAPVPVFGAICNGNGSNAAADTAAFNAALATGKNVTAPANNYCIWNAPVSMTAVGQKLIGDGPQATKILIYPPYDVANGTPTQGALTLTQPAEEVHGIGFSFSQPANPANRAALTTYIPAIMARQAATVLDDILIAGATTCIDMGGNTNAGNSYLYDIDNGCYDYGIRLDGSIDTVRIRANHYFPFQTTSAQQTVFFRQGNIAIDMGRVDDYDISDSLCLGTTCLNFYNGAQGGAFGTVNNYDFDGAAVGILMQTPNASLSGAGLTFSSGTSSEVGIVQTAGKLMIAASSFFNVVPAVMDNFTGGVQTITGSEINQGKNDAVFASANCSGNANPPAPNSAQASPCRITMVGNTIERDTTVTQNPWFQSQGNEIVNVQGNSTTPGASSNGGPNISIANDTAGNRVTSNSSPGRSNFVANAAMPNSISPSVNGVYFGN